MLTQHNRNIVVMWINETTTVFQKINIYCLDMNKHIKKLMTSKIVWLLKISLKLNFMLFAQFYIVMGIC